MKRVNKIKSRDAYKKCQIDYKRKQDNKLTPAQKRLIQIVYKDRDWDWRFIYDLLSVKLKNILEYSETKTVTEPKEWRPEWIKRAITLIDIVRDSTYIYENGFNVNLNNYKRFGKEAVFAYNSIERYKKEIEETGPIRYGTLNGKQMPIYLEDLIRYGKEDIYHIKARHLLFSILEHYIEYWWD